MLGFKMGTQCGRKQPLILSQSSKVINIKNFLDSCIGAGSYQYTGTHLLKTTTFTRSPAPIGRDLQHPDLITNYYWRKLQLPQ